MTEIQIDDAERTRCEIWSRVMGYHRPLTAWNRGKQQEHRDRLLFVEHAPGHRQPDQARYQGGTP